MAKTWMCWNFSVEYTPINFEKNSSRKRTQKSTSLSKCHTTGSMAKKWTRFSRLLQALAGQRPFRQDQNQGKQQKAQEVTSQKANLSPIAEQGKKVCFGYCKGLKDCITKRTAPAKKKSIDKLILA